MLVKVFSLAENQPWGFAIIETLEREKALAPAFLKAKLALGANADAQAKNPVEIMVVTFIVWYIG